MDTIYIISMPPEGNKFLRSRIVIGGQKPPKVEVGESIHAAITTPVAKEIYSRFSEEWRNTKILPELYGPHDGVYYADSMHLQFMLLNQFFLTEDDYILKELIERDDGSLLERVTTRVTTLCSLS